MNGSLRRIGGAAAAVSLLSTVAFALGAAPAAAVAAGTLTMTIDDVHPNTPTPSAKPRPLRFDVTLTNNGALPLEKVTVSAVRSDPIGTQDALDSAIAHVSPPTPEQEAPLKTAVTTTIPPDTTVHETLSTTIGTDTTQAPGVCQCANAIYPVYFTATQATSTATSPTVLATAQTYLPSFTTAPAKATVGWVWPLLDRPHRLRHDDLFTDDDLAGEVATGGRLDKLLDVLESVSAAGVPMTVMTDPDLIDELAVMSTGKYRVATTKGSIPGTGAADAKSWLARLDGVLQAHPKVELVFTAFADPAVESLTQHGLTWDTGLTTTEQQRVTTALGGQTPLSDIVWPVGESLSPATLSTLVTQGVNTVVLSDRTMIGAPAGSATGTSADGSTHDAVPDALAPVQTRAGHSVVAGVTSTPIERLVARILIGTSLAALPQLVAELAIRVITSVDVSRYVLITPPRELSVEDPTVAIRTILATSDTVWSQPLPLRAAASTITPVEHGRLRVGVSTPGLPSATADSLTYVTQSLPTVTSLFADPDVAETQTATMPAAVQRCKSTSLLDHPALSAGWSAFLAKSVRGTLHGVRLISPANGTYTLTSKNAKLPVTVVNTLAEDVQVRLAVTAESPGFQATDIGEHTVRANQRVQLKIPTHVDRVGVITVHVALTTKDGLELPSSIQLKVRSTALGTIGVVITIAAAVVLAVALLVRFTRRMNKRRKAGSNATPDPVPVTTGSP